MSSLEEIKAELLNLVQEAEAIIPESPVPDLDPVEGYPDVPSWHRFEHETWAIGEKIRQRMNAKPRLRSDTELQDRFIKIAKNKNAKRGRQSFIMLLAYKACASRSNELASELDDPFVDGQVIYTWRKMQTPAHESEVLPFLESSRKWVRDEAKKYIEKYGAA